MKTLKEIFSDSNNKWSSKRIIGTLLLIIAISLWINSHFTDKVLDSGAFSAVLYTGGIMITGGVLEKTIKQ